VKEILIQCWLNVNEYSHCEEKQGGSLKKIIQICELAIPLLSVSLKRGSEYAKQICTFPYLLQDYSQ
jgi:hypothetical protein